MKTPVQIFTVSPAEAGQKLLQYLARRLGSGVPQAALQKFIRTGQVRLDGKRCKPFDRISEGQLVRVPPYETDAPGLPPSPPQAEAGHGGQAPHLPPHGGEPARSGDGGRGKIVLDILHEDDELLVVVKPAGLPVHPGSGHPFALTTLLHERHADAPFAPTPAHRLDRDTTGLLLVAKTYRKLRAIHEAMVTGAARKEYFAWVRGRWLLGEEGEWLTLRDRLAKEGGPGRQRVEASEAGKEAVSKVRLLAAAPQASLLEVRLETGRTQQIRAQLASRGYPIVGDAKYGGGVPPLLLHAWRVTLPGEAYCAPPDWPAPWSVTRPRRATAGGCREET
jgi:23S rRNA pseudouridine955/2504/2580 synthase